MLKHIKEINSGMELAQNVYSKLGGILYRKGTVLTETDKEILEAFGVAQVDITELIDQKKDNEENSTKEIREQQKDEEKDFLKLFNEALKVVDRVIKVAQGNAQLPIMELRKIMQPLLNDTFSQYKYLSILKFDSSDFTKYDSHHALSVGFLAQMIGKWLGIEKAERMQLALAGILHDVGMSRIPSNIVNSKEKLNSEDLSKIKNHALYGYQILKGTKGLNEGTMLAVLQHHEREDGSGYPLKLKQNQIHLYAKIIAIADIYQAMISKRSYRSEYSMYQAIEQISVDGFGKLDPKIVREFIKMMTQFANGTKVELSNGKKGIIIFIDQQHPTRPWVKTEEGIINLIEHKELFIDKAYN